MADQVFVGASVVDGTGAPRVQADVAVSGGVITEVAPAGRAESTGSRVDITGLVLSPGFVDMHAHSDLAVLCDPEHTSKVWQGVTTEVVGQDGLSYAPTGDGAVLGQLREKLLAWNGFPDLDLDWLTVGDYLGRIDRQGAAVNVAYLVPHGTVRLAVLGEDVRRPSESELSRMVELVEQGMADGAMGLSTGLTYTPGMYADDDEIVRLLEPVKRFGGYYCPHHRNYGSHVVEGYLACLEIARRAGVALHLAHCHVNHAQNAGRAREVLGAIDKMMDDCSLDVSLDSYPFLAGASYLAALLPSWSQAGGVDAMRHRMSDPVARRDVVTEMETVGGDGCHGMPIDWSTVSITGVSEPTYQWAVGRSLSALAAERRTTPGDIFCDLIAANGYGCGCIHFTGNEDNVRLVMAHRGHTVGSDGILVGDRPHPRGWGTFPRMLGTYVRDLGVLTLEDCIAHMTSRATRRLGITDRGIIREGARADLVVFDPDTIDDVATYEDPRRQPTGVHHVLVNGAFTLQDQQRTMQLPGRSVRRSLHRPQ